MTAAPTLAALPPLPPVTVTAVELLTVELPLRVPFTTSFGRQTTRSIPLIRVRAEEADGWGELVTMPAPVYSEEFTAGAVLALRDHLIPAVLAEGPRLTAEAVGGRTRHLHGQRMALGALELAVLDAQLRAGERSLATHLGAVRDRVPTGVSVGIPDGGVAELIDQVERYLDDGYLRVKAKIQPGTDVAPLTALRERFGASLALQVDANAAYDPDAADDVAALDALDELGLVMIEQPFATDRVLDHARHAQRWRTPVCLDESIHHAIAARDAIALGATAIVNVKLGRVGGVLESVRVRDVCRERAVPVWCGGMLESGVGRAANVALAALDGFSLPGDTSASARYWRQDLTEPFELVDGHVEVPSGPGIGRTPRPEILVAAEVEQLGRWDGALTGRHPTRSTDRADPSPAQPGAAR